MSERSITCSGCGTRYRLPDTFTGSRAHCKKCGATIEVETSSARPATEPQRAAPAHQARPAPAAAPTRHRPAARSHGYASRAARSHAVPQARDHGHAEPHDTAAVIERYREERAPKVQPIYIVSAIGLVIAIIVMVAFGYRFATKDTTAARAPAASLTPPAPAPAEEVKPHETVATKKNEETQKAPEPAKPKPVARKAYTPQALEHLPGTPEDQRKEIDDLMATLTNLDLTRESDRARQRLIEIGEPAVPRLLDRMQKLDLSENADVQIGSLINRTLVGIAPPKDAEKIIYAPQGTDPSSVKDRQKAVQRWFQWWMPTDEQKRGGGGAGAGNSSPK